MNVTLKEAATLCKKSEKTLRRKIEAGLLQGTKEPLEFGGFMWMIDVESLDELYPGSRPNNLPQVFEAPEPPQVRLKNRQEEKTAESALTISHVGDEEIESDIDSDDEEEFQARQSFFDYILDENRTLKADLKEKDARILGLNERAFILERALGEQEGTTQTQSRVLEWFQAQEAQRERKRQENEQLLLSASNKPVEKVVVAKPWTAGLAGAGITLLLVLLCAAAGFINFGL